MLHDVDLDKLRWFDFEDEEGNPNYPALARAGRSHRNPPPETPAKGEGPIPTFRGQPRCYLGGDHYVYECAEAHGRCACGCRLYFEFWPLSGVGVREYDAERRECFHCRPEEGGNSSLHSCGG